MEQAGPAGGVASAFGLRTCSKSAALQRYGVETELKMLMYHLYIPLSQPFSPCLALARETLNWLLVIVWGLVIVLLGLWMFLHGDN